MALAPILPGQKRKNSIPPSHHRVPSIASTASPETSQILPPKSPDVPATIPEASSVPPPHEENGLINFGQNDSAATPAQTQPAQPVLPADLHLAQTQNNGQQQKELERTLRSTSKSPDSSQGGLVDFHSDLKKALPLAENKKSESTSATLVREDTDTKSLDEFVDAKS